jgi:poly-gamma-glutamate capsule biosynthesis protein CapA/YwtB (metallophosphatase superfamily)
MKDRLTLFLCGDVMTGRGVDQILPFPGDPQLYEPYVDSAVEYVRLAEHRSEPMPRCTDFAYIWGEALVEFQREAPQVKVINLETTVTHSDTPWQGKDVHYKMSPENIDCLTAAGIDCCVLANNHMLDWGIPGLLDTLEALDKRGIEHAGAGRNLPQAGDPAMLEVPGGSRVIVFGLGSLSSGIPAQWSVLEDRPGVNVIENHPEDSVRWLARAIGAIKRKGDVVIVSIHWGGNWGYTIPSCQRVLAHRLIDEAEVDIIHGHSSHHVKAIEVYKGRLILYGCGDFLNDYEGIGGYEHFRGDLGLMYFADVDPAVGRLVALRMVPTQVRHFRVNPASEVDCKWLEDRLNRKGRRFRTRVERSTDNILTLQWG